MAEAWSRERGKVRCVGTDKRRMKKICWLHRVESVDERESETTRTRNSCDDVEAGHPGFPSPTSCLRVVI